jgi:phosphoribosylformimino-5-aminoimidazole carboxamide ribotide isomerase
MNIIPAIDLINGACVRLTGGDFARQTTYAADPLAQAQYFEQLGATHLHLVDLDGARAREPRQLPVLERIARHTGLHIDFGGGIAAREPALVGEWLARFGAGRIIIGADFKGDFIAVSAWTEQSTQRLPDFIGAYLAAGATTFICTDVSRDGQLQGPATDTYAALRQQFPVAQFVASGGVTTVADVAAMRELGMAGAIIGKAIYEGTITEAELRAELQAPTGAQA